MEISDEALLAAHIKGDDTAFGRLVERYSSILLGYLTRMTGERQLAEDLFQEVFFRVHSKAGTFREDARFKPWLFTIATNMAIDLTRKRKREPEYVELNGDGQHSGAQAGLDAADQVSPGEALDRSEVRAQVRAAVEQLPDRQKAALMLSYYHGMTYVEIARALECSEGTIKTHMSRALRSLARMLPELEGGQA